MKKKTYICPKLVVVAIKGAPLLQTMSVYSTQTVGDGGQWSRRRDRSPWENEEGWDEQ